LEVVAVGGSWEMSASKTFKNCVHEDTSDLVGFYFPEAEIPAMTAYDYRFTRWEGALPALPFTADVVITMEDGTTFTRHETGTYSGVAFSATSEGADNQRVVTTCF